MKINEKVVYYETIRNTLIHRNAIDTVGFLIRIKKGQVLDALELIKMYIKEIYRRVKNEYEVSDLITNLI